MNAQHMPTPWEADGVRITDVDGAFIANCSPWETEWAPVNKHGTEIAAFIVRACNSHEALVELARAFVSYLEDNSKSERRRTVCLEEARAALKQAEAA